MDVTFCPLQLMQQYGHSLSAVVLVFRKASGASLGRSGKIVPTDVFTGYVKFPSGVSTPEVC